jgi:hypothetical protein
LKIIDENLYALLVLKIELQDFSCTLSDFKPVAALGNGMFGNVVLVSQKNVEDYYAMKSVSREKIDVYRIQNSLLLEREILL